MDENAAKLFERAWPAGLSDEDEAVWVATTPDRRAQALARLEALLDYEEGKLQATPAAVKAGTSAATFFRLAGGWRTTRSLALLVPHGRARDRSRAGEGATSELRSAARSLVTTAKSGTTQNMIVNALISQFGGAAGRHTVRRIVALEHADLDRSKAEFGRRILVDSVVVDLELAAGRGARFTVDLVVDQELGLVLALSRPGSNDGLVGRWRALLDAAERWAGQSPSRWHNASGKPRLEIVLPRADPIETLRHMSRLEQLQLAAFSVGERRTGKRAHVALAGHIGRLILRPRLAAEPGFQLRGDLKQEPTPTPEVFDLVVAQEVASHNERVMRSDVAAFSSPENVLQAMRNAMMPAVLEN